MNFLLIYLFIAAIPTPICLYAISQIRRGVKEPRMYTLYRTSILALVILALAGIAMILAFLRSFSSI